MPDERVEQQWPEVLAMVPADSVLVDIATHKYFIQGTFSVIQAPQFPWTQPTFAVYVAITNGHGRTAIRFRLIDVDEAREPVAQSEHELDFPDPLAVLEVVFALNNLVFPEPGEYRLQLFGAGQPLRERRLQVVPTAFPT
jgi:hypothetical protein